MKQFSWVFLTARKTLTKRAKGKGSIIVVVNITIGHDIYDLYRNSMEQIEIDNTLPSHPYALSPFVPLPYPLDCG